MPHPGSRIYTLGLRLPDVGPGSDIEVYGAAAAPAGGALPTGQVMDAAQSALCIDKATASIHATTDGGTSWTQATAQTAEVTIATADVATMNATPVALLAAPGAGKYIQVESIHWFLDFDTTAYDAAAAGETLVARYTDASGDVVVDAVAGDAIGAAAADYHTIVRPSAELIPVANAALVAHITTGEWYAAAGDSPLKARIVYFVRELAF